MFNRICFAIAGPAIVTTVHLRLNISMQNIKGSNRVKYPLISDLDQKPHGQSEVVRARWMDSVI